MKLRSILKACISVIFWQIQLKFEMGEPEVVFTRKWLNSGQALLSYGWHFLGYCKLQACLSCPLAVLGHTTHYHVSL